MAKRLSFLILLVTLVALTPFRSPAPLTYIPGEGWYYESYGENGKWQRPRAKDQLQVAVNASSATCNWSLARGRCHLPFSP